MKSFNYKFKKTYLLMFTILILSSVIAYNVFATEKIPGTADIEKSETDVAPVGSISPVVTETGKISLSIDGLGVYPGNSGTIQVEKSAGATVRKAYLAAATIWGASAIPNGGVQIDGVGVNWDTVIPNVLGSYNHWADVTSLIKPKIDAAPAGRVDFTITEVWNTQLNDGEILVVILDDPNQLVDNTVVLLFGSQTMAGDTFSIGLADPIDKSDPNLILDFSLGISYSAQGGSQYSIIDVNGDRLTTAAGGQDDGSLTNGALMTVGGLDDSNANPSDPYATPVNTRSDDELYNLIPFVQDGDTLIKVDTRNPSNDDNIFFAALFLGSTTAVVNEGIVLSPNSATNYVGTKHMVKAKMQDDDGNPVVGRDVTIEILSGPHAGMSSTSATDANGETTFTYTGTATGTDVIEASAIDSKGNPITSNRATKEWVPSPLEPTIESSDSGGNKKDEFDWNEDVYVFGSDYAPSTTYDIYVVEDVVTWTDGMTIPTRVPGTESTVDSDAGGGIPVTKVWGAKLVVGEYDIVVDVNGNGTYDEGVDALDDMDVSTAGFFVIPELPLGTILGLASCIAALGLYRSKRMNIKIG